MPYNFIADIFHTKKLCSRLTSSEVRFWTEIGRFAFLRHQLGDLQATYDDHHRLVGKRVVDFLLVLIELFARLYGWGATSDYWFKIVDFAPTGPVDPKFQFDAIAPPTNHFSLQKTRLNVLSHSIKSGLNFLPFCHNQRVWPTDRQIDRQTE